MRRTRILATLGPASETPGALDAMIAAGLDAVRLNFSHGTPEWHAAMVRRIRQAARRAGRPIAILQDLQGPKIRVGRVPDGGMDVPSGSVLTLTARPVAGRTGLVPTDYAELPRDVARGDRILLDDGRIALRVRHVRGQDVVTDVTDGGWLTSHKGLNVPGAALRVPALTRKDRRDARLGLRLGVDFMALSFVRSAADIEALARLMRRTGRSAPIIAKIEKPQAVANLDAILTAADGVMVARGDLGVEVSLEAVPVHQKSIIAAANRAGKLVITATQMLESMTLEPAPTRAEVTDVANAILDGTDALMLSGETAVGRYPVEAVRRMAAIADVTEERLYPFDRPAAVAAARTENDFTPVLARLAGHAARDLDPAAVVVFTRSGRTARLCSDERTRAPIVAFTTDEVVARRLALYFGVLPRVLRTPARPDRTLAAATRHLLASGLARKGDLVVVLAGTRTGPGTTNSLRVTRLGEEN